MDDIQTRATIVATKDGRRVVIPNAVLFTSPVSVASPPDDSQRDASRPQGDLVHHNH